MSNRLLDLSINIPVCIFKELSVLWFLKDCYYVPVLCHCFVSRYFLEKYLVPLLIESPFSQ